MTRRAPSRRRSDWLAGLVVGVAAGVVLWRLPVLCLVIFALLVIPILIRRGPVIGLFGALIGAGGATLFVLGRSIVECNRFDAAPNRACGQPDLTPWLVAARLVFATGVIGSVIAVVGSHGGRGGASG